MKAKGHGSHEGYLKHLSLQHTYLENSYAP